MASGHGRRSEKDPGNVGCGTGKTTSGRRAGDRDRHRQSSHHPPHSSTAASVPSSHTTSDLNTPERQADRALFAGTVPVVEGGHPTGLRHAETLQDRDVEAFLELGEDLDGQ